MKVVSKAKERKLKSFWQAVSEVADIPLKTFFMLALKRGKSLCITHQGKNLWTAAAVQDSMFLEIKWADFSIAASWIWN